MGAPESIALEGKDDQGRRVNVRARIIKAQKKPTPEQENAPVSRGDEEDPFQSLTGSQKIISPPYNLTGFSHYPHESNELGQNIRAMVVNTVGFGWNLKEIEMPEEVRVDLEKEIEEERFRLLHFLKNVHPFESLTCLRKKEHQDKYTCGNGYLELIKNMKGELVGLEHIPGHSIRLCSREEIPTEVEIKEYRAENSFEEETRTVYFRFRKFVMVRCDKPVFFKEAGDPRIMHKDTGEYGEEKDIPFKFRATALIHNKIYDPTTPYGLPFYIGNLLSLEGSRSSEEINYSTLNSNAIPSAIVIVENGMLTEDSISRLQEFVEDQIQSDNNYSKFLLLEGETQDEGAMQPSNFRIKIEPMKRLQQSDELFQEYDENNRKKLRQSFRLPPIFTGGTTEFNRATADTSRDVADEQVFAPERDDADGLMNRHVLGALGARFHRVKSLNPNITDDIELIRLMGISERSGAMTPRRADRIVRDVFGSDIGPMPQGIDLDVPFSVQFANAQNGGQNVQASDANRLLGDLMKLKNKVEKAIASPFLSRDELANPLEDWSPKDG